MQAATTNTVLESTVPTCAPFPFEGKVRAKESARFLGIGVSTFWLFVKKGRIKPQERYAPRISVWDASYIRYLAAHGIPEEPKAKS